MEDLIKREFKDKVVEKIKEQYSEKVVKVNDRKFVEIDIFLGAIRENMFYEALLGAYIKKNGVIKITEEDIVSYICDDYDNSEIRYDEVKECSYIGKI